MNKNKIILWAALILAVLVVGLMIFVKTHKNKQPIDLTNIISDVDTSKSDEYIGIAYEKDEEGVSLYENEGLGFSLSLPRLAEVYSEGREEWADAFSVYFYKRGQTPSYMLRFEERCYIDPIRIAGLLVIPDKFSSVDDWLDYMKEEYSDYYNQKDIERIGYKGLEALKFVDTLENRPDIEGKYVAQERIVVFKDNKIFDLSVYTREFDSRKDIDLILNSLKFLE